MKKALVTGITGQDGSYLVELLLSKGYEVHGIMRRSSSFNTSRIDHIMNSDIADKYNPKARFFYYHGDLSDGSQLGNLIYNIKPDEIYNLAAQSHVRVSFETPEYTGDITGMGVTRVIEAIKNSNFGAKFYQASSSEMFGMTLPPQNEKTPFYPRSPYACAKVYAYWMVVNFREAYSLFASNGILFNHESPRRGMTFITRKVTRGITQILEKKKKDLHLGNLSAKRDWGFAPEYVECMWRLLQQSKPDDYVIGTGESHSVKEFVEKAFDYVGLDYEDYVKIDPRYFRPTEVDNLIADSSKAEKELGWKPKIKFDDLIKIMLDADMRAEGLKPIGEGDEIIKKKFPNRWWGPD